MNLSAKRLVELVPHLFEDFFVLQTIQMLGGDAEQLKQTQIVFDPIAHYAAGIDKKLRLIINPFDVLFKNKYTSDSVLVHEIVHLIQNHNFIKKYGNNAFLNYEALYRAMYKGANHLNSPQEQEAYRYEFLYLKSRGLTFQECIDCSTFDDSVFSLRIVEMIKNAYQTGT